MVPKIMFVFCTCDSENGGYDPEEAFDDPIEAIRLSVVEGKCVAVLDALSLEYYGCI